MTLEQDKVLKHELALKGEYRDSTSFKDRLEQSTVKRVFISSLTHFIKELLLVGVLKISISVTRHSNSSGGKREKN